MVLTASIDQNLKCLVHADSFYEGELLDNCPWKQLSSPALNQHLEFGYARTQLGSFLIVSSKNRISSSKHIAL